MVEVFYVDLITPDYNGVLVDLVFAVIKVDLLPPDSNSV